MSSPHRFPCRWSLSDLPEPDGQAPTVFSCFACGGGSSMGYKLAGFDVVGNCEIDPAMQKIYLANLHCRYPFTMDIRDFADLGEYPQELLCLDVLDGSPPCTTFSMLGDRENVWGVEKYFTEGNALQRLDDLFFPFIELAGKLRPKVVIGENVSSMMAGNACGYINDIVHAFDAVGYDLQIFSLNAARMGVPHTRPRLFFLARRRDLALPPIQIGVNEAPISFGEVRTDGGCNIDSEELKVVLGAVRYGETSLRNASRRLRGKEARYSDRIAWDHLVCPCITSSGVFIKGCNFLRFTKGDFCNVQTFPQDYDFCEKGAQYVCGMSVPPVMMAHVASAVREQWLSAV